MDLSFLVMWNAGPERVAKEKGQPADSDIQIGADPDQRGRDHRAVDRVQRRPDHQWGDESPSERPTKSNLLSVGHGHPRVLPRRSMISRVVAVSPSLLTSTRLHTDQL